MISHLRTLLCHATLAAVLAAPYVAQAGLITVQGGQTVLFNVDMSGLSPAPPYVRVDFLPRADFGASDPGATGRFVFFGEFDAVDPVQTRSFNAGGGLGNSLLTDARLLDGQFSIQLELDDGPLVFDPNVMGMTLSQVLGVTIPRFTAFMPLIPVGIEDPGSVPEPSTAVLALLAALPLLARRGRRAQRPCAV